MKKLPAILFVTFLFSFSPRFLIAGDPITQTYLVNRYSNNAGPDNAVDQLIRLINVGMLGTPLTSPDGDVCANFYVFDNDQTMVACCSCRLTPDELATASVSKQLTSNTLTSVVPTAGVVKILAIPATSPVCSPIAPVATSKAKLVAGYSTHLEKTGEAVYITETKVPVMPLFPFEAAFLSNACAFVQYLGSGRGTCGCTTPGY